jgi:hypothetical protein
MSSVRRVPRVPAQPRTSGSPPDRKSKWLGHSSYVLTLTTYADYIREDDTQAPKLARPIALAADNVVPIDRRAR